MSEARKRIGCNGLRHLAVKIRKRMNMRSDGESDARTVNVVHQALSSSSPGRRRDSLLYRKSTVSGGQRPGEVSEVDSQEALRKAATELHKEIERCVECRGRGLELEKPEGIERGWPEAEVMVIGIAPSNTARKKRKALAGNSFTRLHGLFCDAGFTGSADVLRRGLYITSLIKCIPVPSDAATAGYFQSCGRFLWRQIELVEPRVVILLGGEVLKVVLEKTIRIKEAAGRMWTSEELSQGKLFRRVPEGAIWLALPHPSGLSRALNDQKVRARSVAGLRCALRKTDLVRGSG